MTRGGGAGTRRPARAAATRCLPASSAIFAAARRFARAAAFTAALGGTGVRAPAAAEGSSGWGPLPPESDSTRAVFSQAPSPAWEKAIVLPYYVIRFPIRLTTDAIGVGVVTLDESGAIPTAMRLLGPRRGPFGFLVNVTAGGLSGFGGGVTLLHDAFLAEGNRLKVRTQNTATGAQRYTVGFRMRAQESDQIEVGIGYRLTPNARYFGLGPEARSDESSYYLQELSWLGVAYDRVLGPGLEVEARGLASAIGARPPKGNDDPEIRERFAGRLPSGYNDLSQGISLGLILHHDTTDGPSRPAAGGVRRIGVTRFLATGGRQSDFMTYRVELEQFITLFLPQRILGLRGLLSWSDAIGGATIPFQRLMTNDEPDLLRGYRDFRWRDRGIVIASAEYRWPIYAVSHADRAGLDFYLLSDFGQVFGEFREIKRRRLTTSLGAGIRLVGGQGFLGRLEVAGSREETVLRLRADQVFQFAHHGLYHGRNPVPSR